MQPQPQNKSNRMIASQGLCNKRRRKVFAGAWKTVSKFTFTHVRFGGRHRSTPIRQPGTPKYPKSKGNCEKYVPESRQRQGIEGT
ncbi:hypothetical protein ES319_A08G161100v1 [Gossypium barbadense]|uniref:Uncharacterized protein n=2 Tax=Gossypium TaxID=3633 RepID=A0A5J5USM3_GOSBA|nr:hypothetical protein ES319_A08G161100v1 [Gossypium barbadense]TYH06734.1 hypothetical protein ES288_A08G177100v1 [Gossypium darwinii]